MSFSALISLLLAPAASAVILGEIRSSSGLGELLHAEIDIEEEAADRFDASCVKLYRPAQASADLPWLSAARLSFRRENGKGKLYISSDQPLRDPVLQIGVQSSCAGGRVWRDYTFLVSPVAVAGRELSVSPPSPPAQAAIVPVVLPQKRERVRSTMESRPALRLTAWDAAHPARRTAVGSSEAVIFESALPLRMSSELLSTDSPSEFARELLRLEYRMLAELHEQAGDQLAIVERLRRLERSAGDLMAAGLRLDAAGAARPAPAAPAATLAPTGEQAAALAAPLTQAVEPLVARTIPTAAPQTLTPETADASSEAFFYTGLGAALLFLVLIVIRRRRAGAPDEGLLPMHAPTIVVEHPEFSQPPGPALAVQVADDAAISAPPPAPPAAAQEIPPPPENLGVTPVMELAEIMLSFGRVNGAAQTLQEFIEANPKVAVQPWIRLLEIYRDSGMRADFEALATNLNQNFNVEVVHWDAAAPGERVEMSLELLPHIRDQIDALWGKPECLDYLQQLLRDNRDGQRTGFTLPVVKEILLLIDLMVAEKAATNK